LGVRRRKGDTVNPTLKVMRLDPNLPLPEYKTASASGLDLYSALTENLHIEPGRVVKFGTGVAVEIPDGYEGQVRPRSSISESGLVVSVGTIDSDYRGEIKITAVNAGRELLILRPGYRIAQLVISPVARCEVVEVEELSETERGAGGFGSTGR
jgi:dUTP pyrophosphatase